MLIDFQTLKQTNLPIVSQLEKITTILSLKNNLILQAEPGAGKTTLVPLALLNIIAPDKKIIVLEPRRLAARNAAVRMAELVGGKVGELIGYRIKNEVKISHNTRIEVITEGILTRMLQSDPELAEVGLIIFDEFHERSLHADLGLAFAIEVQQNLRDDLKLLVMSATLDTSALAKLLDDAPIINCPGRCFPVEISYHAANASLSKVTATKGGRQPWLTPLLEVVQLIIKQIDQQSTAKPSEQNILVFLPGVAEINRAKQALTTLLNNRDDFIILSLYGNLPFSEQRQVLQPITNKRKIILSTNIAETSVTIEGIRWVIDSGLMRQSVFDPNVGFNRLRTQKISTASAIQRAGRAGRLAAGFCYRLWPESETLRKDSVAEILRADLASFVLELAIWGVIQPSELNLLNQPNPGMLAQAQTLLCSLNALNEHHKITAHGKALAKLSVHPRIGHMLIESAALGVSDLACLLAAMLEEKDLLVGPQSSNPDYMARLHFLFDKRQSHQHSRQNHQHSRSSSYSKTQIFKQAKKLASQLSAIQKYSQNKIKTNIEILTAENSLHFAGILLAFAFPDRIAQKRGSGYRLANGTGAMERDDLLIEDEFIVIVQLGGTTGSAKIYQAIGLSKNDLETYFERSIIENQEVTWQEKTQSVKAVQTRKIDQLVISSKPIKIPDSQLLLIGLLKGLAKKGIASLPWSKELRQWQSRINLLRQFEPYQQKFPDMSEQNLNQTMDQWLAPYLNGFSKLSQITSEVLTQALKSQLDWSLQQQLDSLMPIAMKVASGSNIKLDYQQGEQPVLAVKLQEMFGQEQTPTIAGGNLKLVIHLLSPAKRPLQITEDLASFWQNSYAEVKKEMRGRYPKHPWPDDPLQAVATKYTKLRQAKIK